MNLPAGFEVSAREFLSMRSPSARLWAVGTAVVLLASTAFATGMVSRASAALALTPEEAAATAVASASIVPAGTVVEAVAPSSIAAEATPAAIPAQLPEPDFVARIVITRLAVDHGIETLGVGADGYMQSPRDGVNAVGWYHEWATPGRAGNSVFSAHETWDYRHGPFYALVRAKIGDEVTIRMTSEAVHRYVVASNRRYQADTMPVGNIIWPDMPASEEWVTFITCGGRFVPTGDGLGEYLDRDVIVAKRVG